MAVLRRIEGTAASLEFGDGGRLTCDYTIRQTSGGGLRVTCALDEGGARRSWFDDGPIPVRLVGKTSGGWRVTLAGTFLCTRVHGNSVTYIVSGPEPLRLGDIPRGSSRLTCALTSCLFEGIDLVELPDGSMYRGALHLDLGQRVILQQRRGVWEQRTSLRESERTAITALAVMDLADVNAEREQALLTVQHLCSLLSLASGTLVSRVSYRMRNTDGQIVAEVISSPPTRPYKPRDLIRRDDGVALKLFIELAYPNYIAIDPIYQFGKVIRAKIDTAVSGFLETRGLTASALIEYIAGIYAIRNGFPFRLTPEKFEANLPALQAGLQDLLLKLFGDSLSAQHRREVASAAQWFNEPSLRQKLKFLVKGLGLPFHNDDVDAICQTRNSLVHRMRYVGDNRGATEEWTRLIHFIDMALLRLLGYRGRYVDCRTWQTADLS